MQVKFREFSEKEIGKNWKFGNGKSLDTMCQGYQGNAWGGGGEVRRDKK